MNTGYTVRFSCTSDDNAGVFLEPVHVVVGCISNGVDVRGSLKHFLPTVPLQVVISVDVQLSVRIHRHHHLSNVCVDLCQM